MLGKYYDFAYNDRYDKFKWDEHMPTESSPEVSQPQINTNRVSIGALTAIVISVGAIIICLHNFYMQLQDKLYSQQQAQQLITVKKEVAQLQNNPNVQTQNALVDVSYLVHLANLHLTVGRDPETALKTLLLAQQALASITDSSVNALKQALLSDIAALRAAPAIHINQTFLEIAALNQQIQTLSPIPTKPDVSLQKTVNQIKSTDEKSSDLPWYRRALESVKQLKSLFVIRHLDQVNTPLFAPDMETNVKQNIAIQFNMAQWALLHRDQKIYQSTLHNVSQWLTRYFALSDAKNQIVAQLATLEKMQMNTTLPTLNNTLTALSAIKVNIKTELPPAKIKTPQPTKTNSTESKPNTTGVET